MMEAAIQTLDSERKAFVLTDEEKQPIGEALSSLAAALQAALPILEQQEAGAAQQRISPSGDTLITAAWLLDLCAQVPSELGSAYLARAVWDASQLTDEAQQQAALFDALGASEEAMDVLFQVTPHLDRIRKQISLTDLSDDYNKSSSPQQSETIVDLEEERRRLLLQEAMDAAQVAALAQAEVEALEGTGSSISGATTTHTVTRTSHVQAQKLADKAAKRAAQAMKRAKDAGAIIEEADLLDIDKTSLGDGGLVNRTQEEVWALQKSLLPDGSRQFYDDRGLPHGTIREVEDGYEKVIIPAAQRNEANLHPRLKISEIMDSEMAKAFAGTHSLNPMQSTAFQVAFHSRDNMLVCAPTGAGKTNVAMTTVMAHFRDVGLVGGSGINAEMGRKVVYIAPMKALAQEVVEKFSSKLKSLRLIVRELTGDMQLTRAEAESAHVIVTTPEKWDVVTRKSGTEDTSLGNQCGLLIIDEVHLLADERGAVVESVVARLHRLVESRQRQVRIVALSATLPNYEDVANFLHVPDRGLFFFGPEHRPVPLQQQFIGVNLKSRGDRNEKEKKMNEICYETVLDSLQRGYQVMVFVHSRKGTGDTARTLAELAAEDGLLERHFVTQAKEGPAGDAHKRYVDRVKKSRNREVGLHFQNGMGIHHAGMLRGDRKLTEQMFNDGAIKVLCCTATLAWGINLPAHTVVIKGTDVYNPEKGGLVDLSILDVQQIFGRAGRPQFDNSGEATLITTQDAFPRYMDKLVRPVPIESNFIKQLADHLNAEVVGGTVTNLQEASTWLTYTYLYVRMMRNPLAYGISSDEKADDPMLRGCCLNLVTEAAKLLDQNQMIRFHPESGNLSSVERGRVAAHFYIQAESIAVFKEMFELKSFLTDADLCRMISSASEFKNMKVRQEELSELEKLVSETPLKIDGPGLDDSGQSLITDSADKVFVLMQAFISRATIKSFTLITDKNYIASNAGRIARSLFEMCLKRNEAAPAIKLLRIAKSVDNQIWWFQTPLRHFEGELRESVYSSLESGAACTGYNALDSAVSLLDMQPREVGQLCRWSKGGERIQELVRMLPRLEIDCRVQPVTFSVLRFHVRLAPNFKWHGRWHGGAQSFWLWVENAENDRIYHQEHVIVAKRTYPEAVILDFSIPTFGASTGQYLIRVFSDTWVGVEHVVPVSFDDIKMPEQERTHTKLQDLTPLPTSALQDPRFEQLYTKFDAFNPIQTQLFHVLYHTDSPVLLGAPTGSGKTLLAELALLRMKRKGKSAIGVYIAPLKALIRERLKEWRRRFGSPPLNWRILELSGDTHHDQYALEHADVLVCTPEKWDLISRGWRGKSFIKRVRLLVLDEVHLLGEERGAVLEAIVSRTRFISRYVKQEEKVDSSGAGSDLTRIIGLSTALANADDLGDWIGIDTKSVGPTARRGLYNFRPSVRPVPVTVHVQGYAGRHYCPRMATMNKPCFAAIKEYSPTKPTLIFVASRRQTRLTAFDIISYAAGDEVPKRFLHCSEDYIEAVAQTIKDEALRHTITFGIGLHHAGLSSHDRDIVERCFLGGQIRVLVATATLAWGVNLPAHLVIVKGTEYFDGKSSRYVDYPLTDVLQMIGRAGRPGFDTEAVAVVMAAEEKKNFYKKFLYEPFPVESCLDQRMCENINAEIASGTISSVVEAVGYLHWTFFARRAKANPSYYGAKSSSDEDVEDFLLEVVKETLGKLRESGCIEYSSKDALSDVAPLLLGTAGASYYLGFRTPKQMQYGVREARKIIMSCIEQSPGAMNAGKEATKETEMIPLQRPPRVDEVAAGWLLYVLCSTHEFDEHPVRHNEEYLNEELSEQLMWGPGTAGLLSNSNEQPYFNIEIFQDPHTKCFLLLQAYIERSRLPISDYVNDTKSVVENVPRLLAAMRYIAGQEKNAAGSFELLTQFSRTRQLFETRSLVGQDPLLQLPGITNDVIKRIQNGARSRKNGVDSIRAMRALPRKEAASLLRQLNRNKQNIAVDVTIDSLYSLPLVRLFSCNVRNEVEKATGKNVGKLKVEFEIEREKPRKKHHESDQPLTMTLILGSLQQRMILSESSVGIGRFGKWNVTKELEFDWSIANADGGEDGGRMILRLLFEEIRGFDCEIPVRLK